MGSVNREQDIGRSKRTEVKVRFKFKFSSTGRMMALVEGRNEIETQRANLNHAHE